MKVLLINFTVTNQKDNEFRLGDYCDCGYDSNCYDLPDCDCSYNCYSDDDCTQDSY